MGLPRSTYYDAMAKLGANAADYPIFPDLTRDKIVDGPNKLWVADITYIAIATGFAPACRPCGLWPRLLAIMIGVRP
jgi:hypothetical protein